MAIKGANGEGGMDHLCQVITPVGMLGYGFTDAHVIAGLEQTSTLSTPTAIILDSGSTDSGPGKLALGGMSCPRASYERDVGKLIKLGRRYDVPIIISSAGGDGADEHVDAILDIIRELAELPGNRFEFPCTRKHCDLTDMYL